MRLTLLAMLAAIAAAPIWAQAIAPIAWTSAAPAVASKFEPAIVARGDTEESMLTVAPDGQEMLWGVSRKWFPFSRVSEIWSATRNGQGWQSARAGFSLGYSDSDPFISYDGKQVFFVSVRPVDGPRKDFDLYVVDRTPQGYGKARNLGSPVNSREDELYPSVDGNGTIYFASERSGKWLIYRSVRNGDGSYAAPQPLPAAVNFPGVWNFNPFISRDGSTLLFTSLNRPGGAGKGDLYVATKDKSGDFGVVRNIGAAINTAEEEFHPTLSPDMRALFFIRRDTSRPTGNADIYWVSTKGLL